MSKPDQVSGALGNEAIQSVSNSVETGALIDNEADTARRLGFPDADTWGSRDHLWYCLMPTIPCPSPKARRPAIKSFEPPPRHVGVEVYGQVLCHSLTI